MAQRAQPGFRVDQRLGQQHGVLPERPGHRGVLAGATCRRRAARAGCRRRRPRPEYPRSTRSARPRPRSPGPPRCPGRRPAATPRAAAQTARDVRRPAPVGQRNMPELDPQDGSVTCLPLSRYTIQSLSMPRLAVASSMPGWCRASQRNRAGVVIDTQSPPRRRLPADPLAPVRPPRHRTGCPRSGTPRSPGGPVVQHDAFAHAGRGDGGDIAAGGPGFAEGFPYAGADGDPAAGHVEVLAAGHTGRLAMGPLPLPGGDLPAGLVEQHGPAAAGAGVDGEQVTSAHLLPRLDSPRCPAPGRPADPRPRPPRAVRRGPASPRSRRRCAG